MLTGHFVFRGQTRSNITKVLSEAKCIFAPPTYVSSDCLRASHHTSTSILSNTGLIGTKYMTELLGRFDRLYKRRAFLSWFGGIDEFELVEARENVIDLISEYSQINK